MVFVVTIFVWQQHGAYVSTVYFDAPPVSELSCKHNRLKASHHISSSASDYRVHCSFNSLLKISNEPWDLKIKRVVFVDMFTSVILMSWVLLLKEIGIYNRDVE